MSWRRIILNYSTRAYQAYVIDRRQLLIRECVKNTQLRVPYVKTVDNLADFFTKPFWRRMISSACVRVRDALMNVPQMSRKSRASTATPLTYLNIYCK
jgi:hypothetical protein